MLFGLGHPMLDVSASVEDEFLRKYSLNPNDAAVADEKHRPLYTELVDKYNCEYTSGGTVPNTLRVFQCVVQTPEVATFVGCIGKDEFGAIIERRAKEDGVRSSFQYAENEPTACCAVLLTKRGKCRSLCTRLGAARLYSVDHLLRTQNRTLMEEASHYYASGFLLNGSLEIMLTVTRHASSHNKVFLHESRSAIPVPPIQGQHDGSVPMRRHYFRKRSGSSRVCRRPRFRDQGHN